MGNARILIVEDNRITAMDLQDTLEHFGYSVSAVAASGKEAIRRANETDPDLVLMDIGLKGDLDGIQTAKEIVDRWDVPVIYVTGNSDIATVQRAAETDHFGYIKKPFDDVQLQAAVASTLERHRKRKHLRHQRDELEIRVQERTAALTQANEALRQEVAEHQRTQEDLRRQATILQTILDSIADGVIVADSAGRFLQFNPAAERIVGFGASEVAPSEWPQHYGLFSPDRQTPYPAEQLPLVRAMRGEEVHEEELMVRRPQAPEGVWLSSNATPLKDASGQLQGGVVVFRDVTERKRAEEQLRRAHAELDQRVQERTAELARSNADLDQFAYVASHDLREPLRTVMNYVKRLEKKLGLKLDEDANQYIGRIIAVTRHMHQLIEDLHTYSRVGRQGTPQPLETAEVFAQACDSLRAAIDESQALLTADEMPAVMAVETELGRLFQNLLGNAIKFRGDRPVQIHVGVERQNGSWLFSVCDNGIGIESKYCERIFGIGERLHSKNQYPGTGFGLAICKKIVERHRGRIWVDSQPGQGSTFRFTIPGVSGDGPLRHTRGHRV